MNNNFDYTLYLITDGKPNLIDRVEQTILGGVTIVQYREKKKSYDEMLEEALELKKLCSKYNVPLIINDYIDLAKEIDADGIHLGQDDTSIEEIKDLFKDKVIGISAHNLEEAIKAEKNGADYIGFGAIFPTNSKDDAKVLDINDVNTIKKNISIPVLLIGGINKANLSSIDVKYDGICVISAILSSKDPKESTKEIKDIILNK
jgi:thiamine-phosphate pyrophosphorylase